MSGVMSFGQVSHLSPFWSLLSFTCGWIPLPCFRSWDPAASLCAQAGGNSDVVELPIFLVDTWGIFWQSSQNEFSQPLPPPSICFLCQLEFSPSHQYVLFLDFKPASAKVKATYRSQVILEKHRPRSIIFPTRWGEEKGALDPMGLPRKIPLQRQQGVGC